MEDSMTQALDRSNCGTARFPWEGSHRSKLMSRRTERPYKVDGTGELAQHSAARCSVPEINGPVVQQEFTFLLRETCNPARRKRRERWPEMTAVREQESAEAVVPRATSRKLDTGRTHNSGRAELGGQTRPSVVLFRKR